MRFSFTMIRCSPDHRWIGQVRGHPLAAVLALILFFIICSGFVLMAKVLRDAYFPYEGQVQHIKSSWLDTLVFESSDYQYLVINTPSGKTIDRIISSGVRTRQRIEPGDYVIKVRGFRNHVRPRDKHTLAEVRETALNAEKNSP